MKQYASEGDVAFAFVLTVIMIFLLGWILIDTIHRESAKIQQACTQKESVKP